MGRYYMVTFVADYFNLSTSMIDAESEEEAIRAATNLINNEYNLDIESMANEILADLEGTY